MNDRAPALLTWRTAVEAAVAGVVTIALALPVFAPIWSAMAYPLATGDMYPTYVNALSFGGLAYPSTTHFGFPLGMDLDYTPGLDITQNAFAHVVDVLTGSPFAGINLLLLVSFPLVAVLAYLLLRLLGAAGPLAIALAAAYATIPFHFGRGLGHTYLATTYSAVTALAIAVVIGLGLVPRIAHDPRRSRRVAGWIMLASLVLVTAWSGLYYAAFAVILGAASVVWRFACRDSWRDLALAVVPVVGVGALAVIGLVPALVTTLTDPPAQAVASRDPADSVTLAGNLALALTPAPFVDHAPLGRYNAAVRHAFASAPPIEGNAATNFGTWVTTACALAFVVGLIVLARRRRLGGTPLPLLAYLTVVVVAFFVPWGLNFLVAQTLTAQIRAWNRLLPILLLLFVAGGAALLARTRSNRWATLPALAAAAVLVVVAVTQVLPFRTAYADGAAAGRVAVAQAREYAADLNAAIPQACGVLQLPYVSYPEQGTIEQLTDYEHFLQPLVNTGKQFSYGAIRGTKGATELDALGNRFTSGVVDRLVAQGFCAVHLDRRGFNDRAWTWVVAGMKEQFGDPVATGADGTWLAFDLLGRH